MVLLPVLFCTEAKDRRRENGLCDLGIMGRNMKVLQYYILRASRRREKKGVKNSTVRS